MGVRKSNVTQAIREFSSAVPAGIDAFKLLRTAGGGIHAGLGPPQTAARRQSRPALVIRFWLLVAKDETIWRLPDTAALEVANAAVGKTADVYRISAGRVGGAIEEIAVV